MGLTSAQTKITPIKIDISTGDVITPRAVEYILQTYARGKRNRVVEL